MFCVIKRCTVQGNTNTGDVYLTSGFQAPTNLDLSERYKISSHFQSFASGGSVEHVFLGKECSAKGKANLINKLLNNPINYITMSDVISHCNKCNKKNIGEFAICPECGSAQISLYGRVIGYVRPIVANDIKRDADMKITGEHLFWQDSRRVDWAERKMVG